MASQPPNEGQKLRDKESTLETVESRGEMASHPPNEGQKLRDKESTLETAESRVRWRRTP